MPLTLTREIRFGLEDMADTTGGANGFAGNPALTAIAPFLTLAATISGEVDAQTGMLVNIKTLDKVMRQHAVPFLRDVAGAVGSRQPATTLVSLYASILPRFLPHRLRALRLALSPYLSLAIFDPEPMMVHLSLRFEFSAAHRLHTDALSEADNWDVFGRCNNPNGHGHNYELEITIAGTPDAKTGQVMAIGELQAIVNERIIDVYDHKHLNLDAPDFRTLNPTVENIAQVLYRKLKPHIPSPARLESLRLWETPKTMAEYRE